MGDLLQAALEESQVLEDALVVAVFLGLESLLLDLEVGVVLLLLLLCHGTVGSEDDRGYYLQLVDLLCGGMQYLLLLLGGHGADWPVHYLVRVLWFILVVGGRHETVEQPILHLPLSLLFLHLLGDSAPVTSVVVGVKGRIANLPKLLRLALISPIERSHLLDHLPHLGLILLLGGLLMGQHQNPILQHYISPSRTYALLRYGRVTHRLRLETFLRGLYDLVEHFHWDLAELLAAVVVNELVEPAEGLAQPGVVVIFDAVVSSR